MDMISWVKIPPQNSVNGISNLSNYYGAYCTGLGTLVGLLW